MLDHQLLDKNGRRCGNVDDLAIEGGAGETPEVVALLVGPGYWPQRAGWIGTLAGWIGGGRASAFHWTDVASVDSGIELKRDAPELGLGRGDDRLRRYLTRSQEPTDEDTLLAAAPRGRHRIRTTLGRCYDLRGELTPTALRVTGLCVGHHGLLQRLGIPIHPKLTVIPWHRVSAIEGKRIIVRDTN